MSSYGPVFFLSQFHCKHFSCHIYPSPQRATLFSGLSGPRLIAIRSPRWHYCRTNRTDLWPPLLTPLYPAQQQLYMVCIRNHYQCLCCVSSMCFRVRLAFAFLTPTTCMRLFRLDSYYVSAIRCSHVTSYLLVDCSLLRLLISLAHFFPSFQKTCSLSTPEKSK